MIAKQKGNNGASFDRTLLERKYRKFLIYEGKNINTVPSFLHSSTFVSLKTLMCYSKISKNKKYSTSLKSICILIDFLA